MSELERQDPPPVASTAEAVPAMPPTSAVPASPAEGPGVARDETDPPNPMLVIISGPSGVGKDTILAALQKRTHVPEYHYVVTCTTRAPRPGEMEGVSYTFLSVAEFRDMRDAGKLLEANEVHGNWYGTPRAGVREALARGQHAILKIDVQGAEVVKRRAPGALLIFVVPPSMETLFEHLKARRTESAEQLEIRQRNAAIELARQDDYDYVVVNEENHVDVTAERIEAIITQEERRGPRRQVVV
jgi:guanylate kinase